jgi:hypothetical protein
MLETTLAWVRFLAPIWIPAAIAVSMWRVWSRPGAFKLSFGEKIIRLMIILAAMLALISLFGHFALR